MSDSTERDALDEERDGKPHAVYYDVCREPETGAALSWSVRTCRCSTPWRHG